MTVLVIHATVANAIHAIAHQRPKRRLDVVEIRNPKLQRWVDVVEIRKLKLQRSLDAVEIRKILNHKMSQKLPLQSEVKRSQSRSKILIKQPHQNLIFLNKLTLLHNIIFKVNSS